LIAGFDPIADGSADAVFLDVPEPWLAVPEASRCLKPSRKLCSYSPCIEQVMKTCVALRANGFHSIRTLETRLKTYDVAKQAWPVPDFGQGATSAGDLAQPVATPGAGSSATAAAAGAGTAAGAGVGAGAGAGSAAAEPTAGAGFSGVDAEEAGGKKRAREMPSDAGAAQEAGHLGHKPAGAAAGGSLGEEWLLARPNGSMRGHTAFLTFATRSSRIVLTAAASKALSSSSTSS
jgi:tRNA (adenine57-N1/adenine58-N1)-methyltransferase